MNTRLFQLYFLSAFPFFILAQNPESEVNYVEGSTEKIVQLVGDFDNQRQQATANLTNTNYSLWGTDLGVPFKHKGKIWVLFGDVPGTDRDPIAFTEDEDPEDGIDLTFLANPNGTYRPITIPGISQGAFEVPTEGLGIGDNMYVFHTTDGMSRSVLAKSEDDGQNFTLINPDYSSDHFINISIVEVNNTDWPGLPLPTDKGLVIFGSGDYRKSDVRMAFQASSDIEDKNSIQYLSGWDELQKPLWSPKEEDAIALFNQPCVGEFSVAFNPFIQKWILLYNCDLSPYPRGILFRTANNPWGPWSEAQKLFDPWTDNGYCHYMHVSWDFDQCDSVHDPGRAHEWGGEYGPYLFEDLTTGNDSITTLYYTLSTWNPYTVVLMKSVLFKEIKTNLREPIGKEMINIFPNPAMKHFNLKYTGSENLKNIHILNALGQKIWSTEQPEKELRIDISQWKKGIYWVITSIEHKGESRAKLIKI